MKQLCTQYLFLVSALFSFFGCVSRAPTECEMDKRSGLYPSSFCEGQAAANSGEKPIEGSPASIVKPNEIPVRSEPLVKRVWVHDQILEGGHWMQGTWLYIEVEPSKWVGTSARPASLSSIKSASIGVSDNSHEPSKPTLPSRNLGRIGGRQ